MRWDAKWLQRAAGSLAMHYSNPFLLPMAGAASTYTARFASYSLQSRSGLRVCMFVSLPLYLIVYEMRLHSNVFRIVNKFLNIAFIKHLLIVYILENYSLLTCFSSKCCFVNVSVSKIY